MLADLLNLGQHGFLSLLCKILRVEHDDGHSGFAIQAASLAICARNPGCLASALRFGYSQASS